MPDSLHIPLLFAAVLWTTYFGEFYRTYKTGKLEAPFSRLIWLAGFFVALIITLSGKQTESLFETLLGDKPVLFYIKYVCALLVISILHLLFRQTMYVSRWKDRIFLSTGLGTIGLGLLTIPLYMQRSPTEREMLRYGLLALRDVVICCYMICIFIPATYALWMNEKVLPTRFKHFAGLMFDLAYLLLGVGNILTFIAAHFNPEAALFVDGAFKPAIAACALFLTVIMMPNRVLARLVWLHERFLLWRLQRLEKRVLSLVGHPLHEADEQKLEDRIYRTVISIMDQHYNLRHLSNQDLYERIHHALSPEHDYPRLIEQLAKLA